MANNNQVIPTGLRADLMRKHMENKNTLTKRGSLYIGTGEEYESASPDFFGDLHCYKTAELEPIDVAGKPLVSKGKDANNNQLGIEWGQVLTAGIAKEAIIGCAGTSEPMPNHNSQIFACSIGNNDIATRAINNSKLVYDAIKIGSNYYALSQAVDSSTPLSTNTLRDMARIEANEFVGGTVTGTIITATNYFNATSDERLKKNIEEYKTDKSILDVPVKQYDYINNDAHAIGFIAQDLQKLFPELVITDNNGYLGIQETKLVYLLMLEVKKLRQRVDELEKK